MGINSKDRRDYYYYQAKIQGYRARSAFKLLDIDKTFNVIDGAERIVDLCAAPGSWSQLLRSKTNAKIIAIDVQEIAPIDGIITLKEDITSQECLKKVHDLFLGEKADLIVCDGAPDVTGFHDLDEFLQADLLKAALKITLDIGREGATFVGKCFRGEYSGYILRHFLKFFESVEMVKPKASRNVSVECFLVCKGMKHSDFDPLVLDINGPPLNFQLKACGDGPDPDFINMDVEKNIDPISPPINPPYKDSIHNRRH